MDRVAICAGAVVPWIGGGSAVHTRRHLHRRERVQENVLDLFG